MIETVVRDRCQPKQSSRANETIYKKVEIFKDEEDRTCRKNAEPQKRLLIPFLQPFKVNARLYSQSES